MAGFVKNKGFQKKGTALFGDTGALANIAVNGDIPIFKTQLNNDSQSIIKNNDYEITIKAGKKVYLDSSTSFAITSAGHVTFRFYNKTTSQYIGVRGQAFTTTFSLANVSSSTNARAEISSTVDTVISCKIEGLTGGPTISMDTNSTRVEEVEAYLIETPKIEEIPYGMFAPALNKTLAVVGQAYNFMDLKLSDNYNAWNGVSYIAPKSGIYNISIFIHGINSNAFNLIHTHTTKYQQKFIAYARRNGAAAEWLTGSGSANFRFEKGEEITITITSGVVAEALHQPSMELLYNYCTITYVGP